METAREEPSRILLIEDNPKDARLFREILGESESEVDLRWEENLSAGLSALDEENLDVIVADLSLPDSEGSKTVERLVEAAPNLPVVVLTGQQTMELAMDSLDAGATEYLRKDELLPGLVARTLRAASERKRIEERLRQSRERYRSLFRDSSDAILVHDLEGNVKEANPRAESLFGLRAEELQGRSISSLFATGEEDTAQEKLEALQAGGPYRAVSRYERADGSEFWGELSASATEIDGETVVRSLIRDVTERKEAEIALREQEAQLRGLANSIPGVIYQFFARPDETYGFNYLSDRAEDLLGLSADTDDFFEEGIVRVPEPYRGRLLQSIDEAVQEGEPLEIEVPFEKPSGERIWLLIVSSAPERHEEEALLNGVFLDITERKRREQELAESEARYRALAESARDAIVTIDADSTIQFANPAVEEVFGYAPEELLGEPLTTLMPERYREEHEAAFDRFLETGERHMDWSAIEFPGLQKDGEEIDLGISFSEFEEEGELRLQGIIRNVTERKERERELRKREIQLEQIRENVTDIVWMSPADKSEIEFVSEAYEDIWGRPTESLIDRPNSVVEAIHPEDREHVQAALETQKENPEAYEETYRVVQPDGEVRWVRDKAAGVYDEDGQLERIVGVATDITEEKEYELELETLTTRLQLALEATNTGIFDWDIETDEVIWDETSERLFGYESGEFPGTYEGWAQRVHPDDLPSAQVDIEQAIENRDEYRTEFRVRDPAGTQRWIQARGVVEYDDDGTPVRMLGIHTDVTERMRKERALREERDLLERIFEISPVAIVLFNREGDFVRASDRAEEVLGLEKDEITDRTYNDPEWSITTPDGEPIPDEELPFARVISTEEPVYEVEHAIEWPDGDRRLLSVSGAPLRGSDGEVEGAVFHIEDVTERRVAERALRESEERFRKVFENAAVGIVIADDEGRVLRANPAFQQMIGYTREELRGCHFEEFTHPDDVATNRRRFQELQEGVRDRDQVEKRYVRKDGSVFWGRLTVSLFEDAGEGHHISLVEDIDEQKRYEKNLKKAKEEAEEAARLKSAMLANMSHEIRTPLTAITGFAELLTEELTGRLREFAERIERSGTRLMRTLNSVLQLSKLEAGVYELEREPTCLNRLVEELTELHGSRAEEKGIALETSVPDRLVEGRWNKGALNRILENLIENAIKFTPEGGTVEVRTWEENGEAVLEVEDTGIGMDPERADELFEAFKQGSEGLDREYEGAGLGLSIVKELTEALGGEITVESEKGKGTCFAVRLPREEGGS